VKSNFISPDAARTIAARYGLDAKEILGCAYDSLFKQLCGQGELKVDARRVLAPFGFVSVLAGVLLAIEVVRRTYTGQTAAPFNYWRVSPWRSPVGRMRDLRAKRSGCEFCDNQLRRRPNADPIPT
jgi:hypothetical protein